MTRVRTDVVRSSSRPSAARAAAAARVTGGSRRAAAPTTTVPTGGRRTGTAAPSRGATDAVHRQGRVATGGPAATTRRAAAGGAAAAPASLPRPAPGGEPQRHLSVVGPRATTAAQRRRRARAAIMAGGGFLLLTAFGLVYLHVLLAQRQFTLDQLNSEVQTQRSIYQKLQLQVAKLGSPQNIVSVAEGKLGMVEPTSITYLSPMTPVTDQSTPSSSRSSSTTLPTAPAGDTDWARIKPDLVGGQ